MDHWIKRVFTSVPFLPSEIKAIYRAKTTGKYDPIVFNTSPAKSLAEAQLNVTGQSAAALYGTTQWQILHGHLQGGHQPNHADPCRC